MIICLVCQKCVYICLVRRARGRLTAEADAAGAAWCAASCVAASCAWSAAASWAAAVSAGGTAGGAAASAPGAASCAASCAAASCAWSAAASWAAVAAAALCSFSRSVLPDYQDYCPTTSSSFLGQLPGVVSTSCTERMSPTTGERGSR